MILLSLTKKYFANSRDEQKWSNVALPSGNKEKSTTFSKALNQNKSVNWKHSKFTIFLYKRKKKKAEGVYFKMTFC